MLRSIPTFLPLMAMIGGLFLAGTPLHAGFTINQRLDQYGAVVQARMKPLFDQAGVVYPPGRLTFVILKAERELQVYASGRSISGQKLAYTFIASFPFQRITGTLGPKLKDDDAQVPEGIYTVDDWYPSSHHLALHVNYPNREDQLHAMDEGRPRLGGNITIHGGHPSTGTISLSNEAAEDLFVLSALIRPTETELIFAPYDLRTGAEVPAETSGSPQIPWLHGLYERIGRALELCPEPTPLQ